MKINKQSINMENRKRSKLLIPFCIIVWLSYQVQFMTAEQVPSENQDEVQHKQKEENTDTKPVKLNSKKGDNSDSDLNFKANIDDLDTKDSNSSFSFQSILKSIIDPVFDETDKNKGGVENKTVRKYHNNSVNKNNTISVDTPLMEVELNKTDKKKFKCTSRNMTLENSTLDVKIINNTRLLQLLNFDKNDTLSDCVLVMFYAPWCRFCAKVAPNYNALARAFPELDVVAVDAAHFSNLNARFGTVSVPNILLFHQSRAVVRFNQTNRQFDNLVSFVKNHTGMEPNTTVNVTEEDYFGPLLSIPSNETDYLLWMSWVFVIIFVSVVFVRSSYGQLYINKIKILWQEHQHID